MPIDKRRIIILGQSNNLTPEKFSWQDDYFAVSVSESQVIAIINYIKNQEKHHSKKSFEEEVEGL